MLELRKIQFARGEEGKRRSKKEGFVKIKRTNVQCHKEQKIQIVANTMKHIWD